MRRGRWQRDARVGRWFLRCHIEFHLGIQFRVRMTFFVFLARRNIAFFRKAFPSFPVPGGLSSEVKWNSTSNLPSNAAANGPTPRTLSQIGKKRIDRIDERKTGESSFKMCVARVVSSWNSIPRYCDKIEKKYRTAAVPIENKSWAERSNVNLFSGETSRFDLFMSV